MPSRTRGAGQPHGRLRGRSAEPPVESEEALAASPGEPAPDVGINDPFYHKASAAPLLKSGLTKQAELDRVRRITARCHFYSLTSAAELQAEHGPQTENERTKSLVWEFVGFSTEIKEAAGP